MNTLRTSIAYFLALIVLSFVIWNYLLFSRYDIVNIYHFFKALSLSFTAPDLKVLSLQSLALGSIGAGLFAYIYSKASTVRRKTKGHVRGSELWTSKQLTRYTYRENETQCTLAQVPVPTSLEPRHFLMGGSTGAGKSVAITEMLQRIIRRGDRVIVTDPNGEFLSRFYSSGDRILNPFDIRGEGWSLYNEFHSSYDYERYAKSIIPPASTPQSEEWHGYAQLLFSETAKQLLDQRERDTKVLTKWLTQKPPEELGALLKGTAAAGLFSSGAEKALASTRFIIARYLSPHQHLKAGKFSLRKWLENEDQSNLFITWREDMAESLKPLISTWMDILCTTILSLPPDPNRRIWIFIDELASLEKLNSLEDALTKGRKHGLRVVAGLQSTAQLDEIYGRNKGTVLRSCFRNLLILGGASSDPDTAETFSRSLGERDIERKQNTVSRNSQGVNRTQTTQRVKERLVLPSEIARLADLSGFLSFAGDYPIAKVKLNPLSLPIVTPAFEKGEDNA